MQLIEIYEQYKSIEQQLQLYLEKFIATETITCDDIQPTLEEVQKGVEHLLTLTSSLEVEEAYEEDSKDLRYLITDTFFLLADLINFCHYQELGRCQMRAINYLGKRKRVEIFGQ